MKESNGASKSSLYPTEDELRVCDSSFSMCFHVFRDGIQD